MGAKKKNTIRGAEVEDVNEAEKVVSEEESEESGEEDVENGADGKEESEDSEEDGPVDVDALLQSKLYVQLRHLVPNI